MNLKLFSSNSVAFVFCLVAEAVYCPVSMSDDEEFDLGGAAAGPTYSGPTDHFGNPIVPNGYHTEDLLDGDVVETGRYGTITQFQTQPGAMQGFLIFVQNHLEQKFGHGGDTGATMACVLMASMDDPDSCRILEQWESQEDYQKSLQGPLKQRFDAEAPRFAAGPPIVSAGPMNHFQKKDIGGQVYGSIACFALQPGKMDDFEELYRRHFDRQVQEPEATLAIALKPENEPNTVFFLEQWVTENALHRAPNQNMQEFMNKMQPLVAQAPTVKKGTMLHRQVPKLASMPTTQEAETCCCTIS